MDRFKRKLVRILFNETFKKGAPIVYQTEGVPVNVFLDAVMREEFFPILLFRKPSWYKKYIPFLKSKEEQKRRALFYIDSLIFDKYIYRGLDKLKIMPKGEQFITYHYYLDLIAAWSPIIAIFISATTLGAVAYQAHEAAQQSQILQQQNQLEIQPYLILERGNQDATVVPIDNAGKGLATDVYAVKHIVLNNTDIFSLTKNGNVGLAIASGEQKDMDLNSQDMDILSKNELAAKIPCITKTPLLSLESNWIAFFYKDLYGNHFVSIINGSETSYDTAVDFQALNCNS